MRTVIGRDSAGAQLSQATLGYDLHGRQTAMTGARNGTTTYTHRNGDPEAMGQI